MRTTGVEFPPSFRGKAGPSEFRASEQVAIETGTLNLLPWDEILMNQTELGGPWDEKPPSR
jgi:hypothetical protein